MQHGARVENSACDSEHAADEGQRRAFEQEQFPHAPRRETQRQQSPDFRRALLQAELKEQRHQDERRADEEKAEPDKQPAEVLGLRGGTQCLLPNRTEGEAQFSRLNLRSKLAANFRPSLLDGGVGRNDPADGGEFSKPVPPHLLAGGESDEGFGRAAPLLPIGVVLGANLMHQREARVPVVGAFRLRDAGKFWHEGAIRMDAFQRDHLPDPETIRALDQLRAGVRQKIGQLHLAARPQAEIIGQPLVDPDLIVAHVRRRKGRSGGGHH